VKKHSSFKQRLGLCYKLCGDYLVDHRQVVLCHGTLTRPDHVEVTPESHRLLDHAWIEYRNTMLDLVLDLSLPAVAYYRIFRIDPESVKRYTYREAGKLMLKTGHYGPWT
jgi:hypothetical protein